MMAPTTNLFCLFAYCAVLFTLTIASTSSVTVLTGSSIEIDCPSKFVPPTWSWKGFKQSHPKTLAFSGTQPHPNLEDSRFSFFQKDSNFKLRLYGVKVGDAGAIYCQGDSFQQTLVNVIR